MSVPGENICPSRKFVRDLVIEKLRDVWDEQWRNYPKARQSKIFYSNQDKKRAKEACSLSRRKLSRLIRIISGHNGLLYHQHNIENSIDPSCRFCNSEVESFSHFLLCCPSFDADRQNIFQGRELEGTMNWKINELLEFSFLPRVHDALTWRNNNLTPPDRAQVVIHDFSDSDSNDEAQETALTISQDSVDTEYDSDYNEDVLDNSLDPVFQ